MFVVINPKKLLVPIAIALLIIILALVLISSLSTETFQLRVANLDDKTEILIIDAGHGGADGGAQSKSGLLESTVNLDIALRVEALAGLMGVDTVMTRTSEEIDYPETAKTIRAMKSYDQKRRLELINSFDNAVLLSIHQNKFPTSSPRGSLIMYAKTDGSKELGIVTHENMIKYLYPENRRVAMPVYDDIFLFKNVDCTAILAECGFLSNPDEANLLSTEVYRTKIAAILLTSYLQYMKEIS